MGSQPTCNLALASRKYTPRYTHTQACLFTFSLSPLPPLVSCHRSFELFPSSIASSCTSYKPPFSRFSCFHENKGHPPSRLCPFPPSLLPRAMEIHACTCHQTGSRKAQTTPSVIPPRAPPSLSLLSPRRSTGDRPARPKSASWAQSEGGAEGGREGAHTGGTRRCSCRGHGNR